MDSREADDVVRVDVEQQSIYRRGRTRGKLGTASDAATKFELLKNLACGQPRVAHVVKTCNTRETHVKHVIIRVPAVTKIWGDAVRRDRLGVRLGQSTIIGRVLRVGITGNSMCLAAYHWQMDFSVLSQCLGSASAVEQPSTAIHRTKQSQTKIDQKLPLTTPSTRFSKLVVRDLDVEFCVTGASRPKYLRPLAIVWLKRDHYTDGPRVVCQFFFK